MVLPLVALKGGYDRLNLSYIKQKLRSVNHDYIKLCSVLLSIIIIGIILGAPSVYASTKNDTWSTVKDWAQCILENGSEEIVATIKGTGTYSEIYAYVTGVNILTTKSHTSSNQFEHDFREFNDLLKFIAGVWVLIMAAARMIKGMDDGREGMELVLKFFFELCVTIGIIINLDKIIPLLCEVITALTLEIEKVSISISRGSRSAPSWENFLTQAFGECPAGIIKSALWNVGAIAGLILPWAMSKIVQIASLFVLLQTLLEIGIRRAFLSFAVADVYSEGLRSPGVRYIKKLLGAILKFAICIVASKLSTLIGVQGSALNYAFTSITINLAAVGVMFKSGEYVNDLLGV